MSEHTVAEGGANDQKLASGHSVTRPGISWERGGELNTVYLVEESATCMIEHTLLTLPILLEQFIALPNFTSTIAL